MAGFKKCSAIQSRINKCAKSLVLSGVLAAVCVFPITVHAQSTMPSTAPTIDFRILSNPHYSYAQIVRARSFGLNDGEVSRVIEIAIKADVPTSVVLDEVRTGWTFSTIDSYYGVSTRQNSDWYRAQLDNYLAAYHATGNGALMSSAVPSGS